MKMLCKKTEITPVLVLLSLLLLPPHCQAKLKDTGEVGGHGEGRSQHITMLNLSKLKEDVNTLRTTVTLPAIPTSVSNAVYLGIAAVLLAAWVTIIVYWLQGSFLQRRLAPLDPYYEEDDLNYSFYYPQTSDYSSRVARVLDYRSGFARVLDFISPDTLSRLVEAIDPRPSISRMGEGAVESVEDIVYDTISQGVGVISQVSNSLEGMGDIMRNGVGTFGSFITDKNVTDCMLQVVCYLSSPNLSPEKEARANFNLILEAVDRQDEFTGRKLKERKEKRGKKKDKEENVDNKGKEEKVGGGLLLEPGDCEVFNCPAARVGRNLVTLAARLNQLQ